MTLHEEALAENEPYVAGLFEFPDRTPFFRYANAFLRYCEARPLPRFNGRALYPYGLLPPGCCSHPHYSWTMAPWSADALRKNGKPRLAAAIEDFYPFSTSTVQVVPTGVDQEHVVGGNGWTHSIPNYARIVAEGLDSYRERVGRLPPGDFRDGLMLVLDGIDVLRGRCLSLLRGAGAPQRLLDALERVPFQPARDFYEGIVCMNFVFYVDGCDDPGSVDKSLRHLFDGGDQIPLIREYFQNAEANDGWSGTVGPDYTPLALQCVKAVAGLRRPNLELRVTPDMPDAFWKAAEESIATGCGQPSLYNEEAYREIFRRHLPEVSEEDVAWWSGGGCTETMVAGRSNVGSTDAGLNTMLLFSRYMRANLASCPDFETFYRGFVAEAVSTVRRVLGQVNEYKRLRAERVPHPVRTLLIDDCIDSARDFNDGGPRYLGGIFNFSGLVNVVDSLLAVECAVFGPDAIPPDEFLSRLESGDAELKAKLSAAPHHGVDDPRADALARRLTSELFSAVLEFPHHVRGHYLPGSIQFTTYEWAGALVPASPDGRPAGAPLCDSMGPLEGKSVRGPTAALASAAAFAQELATGTAVMNLRLSKATLRESFKALVLGYFAAGGMQLQVTCASKEDMLDAIAHPGRHEDLIVRTGGYSEYFNRLSAELKRTILARPEF